MFVRNLVMELALLPLIVFFFLSKISNDTTKIQNKNIGIKIKTISILLLINA